MNLLQKLARWNRRRRVVTRGYVWTRDDAGRVFHYDISIAPVHDRSRFVVRFIRSRLGMDMKFTRIMRPHEVQKLQLQMMG